MSFKKISFTFAITLFISLVDFTYSVTWTRFGKNSAEYKYFSGPETLCVNNRIGVKFNGRSIYYIDHFFEKFGGRRYIWSLELYNSKGGTFREKTYSQLWTEDYPVLAVPELENYAEFLLINKPLSLDNFFNTEKDSYINIVEEIDFEWFDYSAVTSFENAFKGLTKLKSIKFKSNWKRCDAEAPPANNRPKPKVITNMLKGCTSLESVDLSVFDTSLVEDMSSLLDGCKELKALDISNFYFKNEDVAQNILSGVEKLKYIALDNITGSTEVITSLDIFNNENLLVCQDQDLIQTDNEFCCDNEVVNGEIKCLPSSNFIVLYYSQNCDYDIGFKCDSDYRNGRYLIFYNEEFKKNTDSLNINAQSGGLTLTIYFYSPLKSLESFFDKDIDDNMVYVKSIDLSNFDSSKVTNMKKMFYNSINLKSIDLRNFKTTEVTEMSNLFNGCTSLEILYMSEFNILENTATENMFQDVNKLKYLGIDNVKDANEIITNSPLNSINDLIVCQSEKLITNSGARNICCSYDIEEELCIYDNYIRVSFNESSDFTYDSGFKVGNDFRKIVSFIMKDNVMYGPEDKLEIKQNSEIEIYIFNYTTSLEKFFSKEIDDKVQYIKTLNFSNFKTSLVKNMNSMFYGCSLLESLDLSVFDTSSVNDTNSMFYGCSSLESLDLSNFKTSLVTDMNSMFYGCSSLVSLDLSKFVTSSVNDMSSMFYGCSSLESLDLSNFNTSLVRDMASMFYNCSSLELLDFSNFTTSLVTNMNSMFYGCSSLKFLDLSNFNTSLVSDMASMFYNCSSLELLDINSFNISNVTSTDNIFDGLNHLQFINLYNVKKPDPDFIKESYLNKFNHPSLKVCQIEDIIQQGTNVCNKVENQSERSNYIVVYFESSTEYKNGFLNKYRKGIDIIVVNENEINATDYLNISSETSEYKIKIYLSMPLMNLGNFFNYDIDNNTNKIQSIDLSNLDFSFIVNMNSAFKGCSKLESIVFPNIEIKRLVNMDSMFYGCSSLESLDFSNFNTSSVKNMDSTFYGCSSLESLDLSSFNTSSVTNMDSMFYGCNSLKFLDIYSFDMKSVTFADDIFSSLSRLKYINIYHVENSDEYIKNSDLKGQNLIVCQKEKILTSNTITDQCCYYDMENQECESETSNFMVVYYGKNTEYSDGDGFAKDFREGIKFIINSEHNLKINGTEKLNIKAGNKIEIYFSKVTNLQNFFSKSKDSNVKNIISIDLSHLDASLVTNFNSMFYGCSSLKSIDLTNFNTSSAKSMISMFCGCTSLQSIDLSYFDISGVTAIYNMFSGCNSLEYVDLSSFNTSSVKRMDNMFSGCSKLQYLDLSNFDTSKVTQLNSMFSKCVSLKVLDISSFDMKNVEDYENMFLHVNLSYLNLYDAKNFIVDDKLNSMNKLTVCQKETILNNENIHTNCCYFDISKDECISSNFILIKYGKNTTYENGFGNEFRNSNDSYFIINRDYNKRLNSTDKLNIIAGKKLGIYYLSNITTMENYFSSISDDNTKYIVSIDLSHLNIVNVDNMTNLFYGCESLQSIIFVNSLEDSLYFDTSLVNDMNQMFYGCSSLESLDLSIFDTSSVTNMNSIFSGCSSLKVLDLSHFETSKVSGMDTMFYGCTHLKYLDISAFNFENITDINNLFGETNDLSYINIFDIKDNKEKMITTILYSQDKWENLTVCQKEKLITKGVINSECCYFNVTSEKCESSNYITVYFGENADYDNGFAFNEKGDEFRKDIDFIINGNHEKKVTCNEKLTIRKGTKIEIYFASSITSLENYFSSDIDPNMKKIISVDLTHFNFSSITSMSKMFYGCNLLKTILLYGVDTSNVTDMSSMFEGCSSLEVLDLSNIDTSSVTDMSSTFSGCVSLKVLDISHFNMEKISKADTMFFNTINIKYINLYDTKNAKKYISQSELKEISNLTVCQKESIITNENRTEECCYYNLDNNECESTNYITVYYGEKAEYDNGFLVENYRNDLEFIINGVYNIKQNTSDNLIVLPDSKIEIHFSNPVRNLGKFFSSEIDPNMAKITSIDFSHFNTSLIEDITSMFSGCSSLKSIDLSFFDTSKIVDMSNMFLNCTSLEILDLSTFDTSSVTNMNSMFSGCESLKFLDISNFNMEKITNAESMFDGINNLKYINLYNLPKSYNYISETGLNKIENLTVCQKQKIISNENATENCCYYDLNTNECTTSTNYIIIFYGDRAEYPNGFIKDEEGNEFRQVIDFIINGEDHNKKIDGTTELNLHKGSKIEIYFSNSIPLTTTQSFFDSTKDSNTGKIVSIDLNHFNSSNINNMNSMFSGCSSLKSIDLSFFDTSKIVDMSNMFLNCTSLEILDLSSFDTSSVTNMNSMFSGCESLKFLDISSFNMTLITGHETMFDLIDNLIYINLYYVQDPNKVLSEISNLQNETIVCQKKNEKIITNAEAKCCYYNAKEEKCESSNFIAISFSKDTYYSKGFANDYRKNIQFIINKNSNSKISGEDDLYLPAGSKLEIYYSSPVESLENYFNKENDINVENIVSIDFANFDTSKVTNMKSTFFGCSSLKSLDISTMNTSQVTTMNSMFSECSSLESIDLSSFDLSSVVYMNYMFSGCISLLSVDLSKSEAKNVISTVEMFSECKSLRYISLKNVNTSLVTNMNYMFSGCSSLEYLDISHFSSAKATKFESMFEEITNLKYISLYKAEDANNAISNSILSNLINLTVCQQKKILVGDNLIEKCCQYDIEKNECEYMNYIIVYYGENVKYQNGFKNDVRKDIAYKINVGDNDAQNDTEVLEIEKDVPIKISFDSPLTSLKDFFYAEEDTNAAKIISIDFSNFDSSKIENLDSLFYACSALKSIDFSYFNSSLVTNMKSMFGECSSLELIDLSSFDASLVTSMESMFSKCSSLKAIDLSNFNTPSLTGMQSMFSGCSSLELIDLSNFNTSLVDGFNNLFLGCTKLKYLDISSFNVEKPKNLDGVFTNVPLKYLNIYNIADSKNKLAKTELNNLINLTVCQKSEIFTNENINYQCCKYNIETEMCELSNYITVYFSSDIDEDIEYANGFECDDLGYPIEERKDKIDFILNGNDKTPINSTQPFIVKKSKIDIFFKNITSLKGFFDSDYDMNTENIISIDLSHLDSSYITDLGSLFSGCFSLKYIDFLNFDTSKLTNMESMFEGCISLEFIDLSNFKTSLVTKMNSMFSECEELESIYLSNFDTSSVENMNSMFSGCNKLESIDLSYFNTSLVTDMRSMFSNCQSLKVLDISNFNMENVIKSENMFSEVNNLRYINTYNIIDSKNIIGQSDLKNLANLIVCGQTNILEKEISQCCYYDYKGEKEECISTNYMIVYYDYEVEYPDGFQNKFRNDIFFIINRELGDKLNSSASFNIYEGNKIVIYFNSPIKTLESFFDINYDSNVENILSIDFTHFDFSEITDMNNMFTGCNSLESIIFPDITSSKINNMHHMFFGCSQLLSVNLSVFNTEEVTDMSYMFYDCSSLQYINFSNFNASKVTKMNNMFYRCESLEKVNLSTCETPLLTNLEKMFYKCQNLKEINLANFTTSSVISMDEMFYDCNSLTYLDISNFDMINCNSYSNMFSNISSLKYINLINFKNDKAIGEAFNKAKNLFVCQKENIITNRKVYFCCEYNFETNECDAIPSTIISSIPTFMPETSNINVQMSDTQDINPSSQNTNNLIYSDEKETYPNDSTEETNILSNTEYFTEDNILAGDTTFKTSSIIMDNTKINTSIIEQYSYNEENSESISSTNENKNIFSTSTNEKINIIDSNEYDTFKTDETPMTTSRFDSQNPTTFKAETQENTAPKLDTTEFTIDKLDTKESTASKLDTTEFNTEKSDTKEPTSSKLDTIEFNIDKFDTTEHTSPKLDITELKTEKSYTTERTSPKVDTTELTIDKSDTKEPIAIKLDTTEFTIDKFDSTEPTAPKIDTTELTTDKLDSKELTALKLDTTEFTNDKLDTTEPTAPKLDTTELNNDKLDTTEPTAPKIDTTELTTEKSDTKEPTAHKLDTTELTTEKSDTKEPTDPKLDTKEPTIPKSDTKEPTIPKLDTKEPTSPKLDSKEPTIPKLDSKEPTIPKLDTKIPTVPKLDTKIPTVPKLDTNEHTAPKLDTKEPTAPKLDTKEPTAPKLDTKEPIIPKLDSKEHTIPKLDTKEPTIPKLDSKEPTIPKLDTKEPKLDTKESTIPKLDTKEPTIPKLDTKEPITSKVKTEEPKIDTKEPITSKVGTEEPKIETKEPITSKVETEEPKIDTERPNTSKLDTKEPINSIVNTQESKTSIVNTEEPTTSKEDSKKPTDSKSDTKESITSKVETKEPITSEIKNTDKPSSQKEYNTQNTPYAEKTENISPKTSIVDNQEQITNIPSIKANTEQPRNSQIDEKTEKITSHTTNENIEKTTKPSIIEKTSIVDNTEKTNTQAPTKENTEKIVSTSSLPEQITNKPSINKEPESTAKASEREEIKHTTSSPDEATPTTNKNNNDVVHTTIPTSLNLTSLPTNPVENPKTTIIQNVAQKTEEINIQEDSGVVLVGVSHFNFIEQIIRFIIYFSFNEIFSGSSTVKLQVELTTKRVLRVLQTQEAECELVDKEKGDLYAYLCEVQTTSSQNIKNVKIVNKFEFSSLNHSVIASVSPIIEQYMDNIQEIENKLDFLMNTTLYTLANPKIEQGEKQIFNISGVINDPKPKFEKVDLNLSVSVEYENKTEEKQLECSIIDIIENNYTLSCIGIKNTNFSLQNAMSVIEDETLIIRFGENENNKILYYSDENTKKYSIKFFNNKSGNIGAGGIIAIILACLFAVAALIFSYNCLRKGDTPPKSFQESTIVNLNN